MAKAIGFRSTFRDWAAERWLSQSWLRISKHDPFHRPFTIRSKRVHPRKGFLDALPLAKEKLMAM